MTRKLSLPVGRRGSKYACLTKLHGHVVTWSPYSSVVRSFLQQTGFKKAHLIEQLSSSRTELRNLELEKETVHLHLEMMEASQASREKLLPQRDYRSPTGTARNTVRAGSTESSANGGGDAPCTWPRDGNS